MDYKKNNKTFCNIQIVLYICTMKSKGHTRTNQRTAAQLRREVARLGGIIKAKKNLDAAKASLDATAAEINATPLTPYLMVQNGWSALYDNCMASQFCKGAFYVKFIKSSHTNKTEFVGNFRDNRIELRKPTITVFEVNKIMQIFGNPELLQPMTLKPY